MVGRDTQILLGEAFDTSASMQKLHTSPEKFGGATVLLADLSGSRVVSTSPYTLGEMGFHIHPDNAVKLFEMETDIGSIIADSRTRAIVGSKKSYERSVPIKVRSSRGYYVPVYHNGIVQKIRIKAVRPVPTEQSSRVFTMTFSHTGADKYVVTRSGIIIRMADDGS